MTPVVNLSLFWMLESIGQAVVSLPHVPCRPLISYADRVIVIVLVHLSCSHGRRCARAGLVMDMLAATVYCNTSANDMGKNNFELCIQKLMAILSDMSHLIEFPRGLKNTGLG